VFLRSVYGNAWKVTSSAARRKFQKIFPLPLVLPCAARREDWGTTVRSHTLAKTFGSVALPQRHGTYEVSLKSRIKISLGFKHSVFGSVASFGNEVSKIFDFTLDAANRACFGASGCHYFRADMLPDRYGRITSKAPPSEAKLSITPLLTLSIIAEKHYETNTLQMLHIPKRRSLRNCKFQSYVFRCPSRSTQN